MGIRPIIPTKSAESPPARNTWIAEQALQKIRPLEAWPVPEEYVIRTPVAAAKPYFSNNSFDQVIYEMAAGLNCVRDRVIAFDLDDTLLNTNFICSEDWDFPPELGPEPKTEESIYYSGLRHSASYWFKAGWRWPKRRQYASSRYPFLMNPDVVAQLRPGALALLHGLKSAGARLLLATICARPRLEFLFSRLPALKDAFIDTTSGQLLIATAEDLAQVTIAISDIPEERPVETDPDMGLHWSNGFRAHVDHPLNFAIKSFPALHVLTGINRLDLLVDDSQKGADTYRKYDLGDFFLQAPRLDPYGAVVMSLLQGILSRFGKQPVPDRETKSLLENGYPWIRFEDPLYFPFVHKQETLTDLHEYEK